MDTLENYHQKHFNPHMILWGGGNITYTAYSMAIYMRGGGLPLNSPLMIMFSSMLNVKTKAASLPKQT